MITKLSVLAKARLGLAWNTTMILASLTPLAISEPSYARSASFYCAVKQGVPTTFLRNGDGQKFTVMRWTSNDYFPPHWNNQRRCKEVSRRFQRSHDNGTLKKIISGTLNGHPVICAVPKERTHYCRDNNLLFTLKQGASPTAVIYRLFDRRVLASGLIVEQSSEDTVTIDFDLYLRSMNVER